MCKSLNTDYKILTISICFAVLLLITPIFIFYYNIQNKIDELEVSERQFANIYANLTQRQSFLPFRDFELKNSLLTSAINSINRVHSELNSNIIYQVVFRDYREVSNNQIHYANNKYNSYKTNVAEIKNVLASIIQEYNSYKTASDAAISLIVSDIHQSTSQADIHNYISKLDEEIFSINYFNNNIIKAVKKNSENNYKKLLINRVLGYKSNELNNRLYRIEKYVTWLEHINNYQKTHLHSLNQLSIYINNQYRTTTDMITRTDAGLSNIAVHAARVHDTITILNQPISGLGRIGSRVTPLSIIRGLEPTTGMAITSAQEVSRQIINLDRELSELSQRLNAFINETTVFRSNPNRDNAIKLHNEANELRMHLSEKSNTLFAPVTNKINESNMYLSTYRNVVQRINNNRARGYLLNFYNTTNDLLSTAELYIDNWKGHLDDAIHLLNLIEEWEITYLYAIENFGNDIDFNNMSMPRFMG